MALCFSRTLAPARLPRCRLFALQRRQTAFRQVIRLGLERGQAERRIAGGRKVVVVGGDDDGRPAGLLAQQQVVDDLPVAHVQ